MKIARIDNFSPFLLLTIVTMLIFQLFHHDSPWFTIIHHDFELFSEYLPFLPITEPIGSSMVLLYMVTWIPSIYPSYVSIYTSTMDPMGYMKSWYSLVMFHSCDTCRGLGHPIADSTLPRLQLEVRKWRAWYVRLGSRFVDVFCGQLLHPFRCSSFLMIMINHV